MGKFAHFAPRWICRTTWIWVKCFIRVFKHTMAMTKIDSRKKWELKWPENVDFSNISKNPIHFLWISYIKYDPPSGGSNDLQKCRIFFSKLFMIFLHKKKNADKNLKKIVFLEHPSRHAQLTCISCLLFSNFQFSLFICAWLRLNGKSDKFIILAQHHHSIPSKFFVHWGASSKHVKSGKMFSLKK